MKKKIKLLISKIKTKIKQNRCFSVMEGKGMAAFGMCCGIEYNDIRLPAYAKKCITCPYFHPINKER